MTARYRVARARSKPWLAPAAHMNTCRGGHHRSATMPSVLQCALAAAAFLACSASRLDRCTEEFYEQELDHFRQSSQRATWRQRYYVCDEYWRHSVSAARPIFFYTGALRCGWPLQRDLQLLALVYVCNCIPLKLYCCARTVGYHKACFATHCMGISTGSSLTAGPCLLAGNEGDVEMYVNFTGFMWEAAEYFGALLVFAEVLLRPSPLRRDTSTRVY